MSERANNASPESWRPSFCPTPCPLQWPVSQRGSQLPAKWGTEQLSLQAVETGASGLSAWVWEEPMKFEFIVQGFLLGLFAKAGDKRVPVG